MKKALIVIISVLLTVLQVTLTSNFKIGWLNYNFALMSVVIVAWIFDDASLVYLNAIFTGVVHDLFSAHFWGYNIIMYIVFAFVLLFLSKQMHKRSIAACLLLSFFVTVISEFITYLVFFAAYGLSDNAFALSKIIFPQGLVNCIPGIIVYVIYTILDDRLKIQKRW
jgi:rod shape-determining protein MreD